MCNLITWMVVAAPAPRQSASSRKRGGVGATILGGKGGVTVLPSLPWTRCSYMRAARTSPAGVRRRYCSGGEVVSAAELPGTAEPQERDCTSLETEIHLSYS